jgi:hypothetical protein
MEAPSSLVIALAVAVAMALVIAVALGMPVKYRLVVTTLAKVTQPVVPYENDKSCMFGLEPLARELAELFTFLALPSSTTEAS